MSAYQRLLEKMREENVLFSALIELTYKCNLDCYYCYNDRDLPGDPLSREQYFQIFRDLRDIGCLHLALTGGEPLAHKDFFSLGAEARRLGFVIRVKSNGHALSRRKGERIRDEIAPYGIDISIHGARPETHDRQTRVPGSFRRLLGNIEYLQELGLRVKLNATLTAWNEDELEAMYDLAELMGLGLQVNPHVSPRDNGDTEPLRIAASPGAVALVLRRGGGEVESGSDDVDGMQEAPTKTSKNCGAGSTTIAVDPMGNVFPCVQWRTRPIGNLHESSIREIWEASPVVAEVRRLNVEARTFAVSADPSGIGGGYCPALAEQMTGNAARDYPMFRLQLETTRKPRSN